jgi:hypothetical protein
MNAPPVPVVISNPYTMAQMPPGVVAVNGYGENPGQWGAVPSQPVVAPQAMQQMPPQAVQYGKLNAVDCGAACLMILATIALTVAFIAWGYLGWLNGKVETLQSQLDALRAKQQLLLTMQGGFQEGGAPLSIPEL